MAVRKSIVLVSGEQKELAVGDALTGLRMGSFFLKTVTDQTIVLMSYATFAIRIKSVKNIKTSAGTVSAAFKINGTNITGLSSVSVTSTTQSPSASALNTMTVGDRLTIVLSSSAGSPTDLEFTLDLEV